MSEVVRQPSWQDLLDLVTRLDGGDFESVAIQFGDVSVRLSRTGELPAGTVPAAAAPTATPAATASPPDADDPAPSVSPRRATPPDTHQAPGPEEAGEAHPAGEAPGRGEPVPSPMLGTFYRSPSPGAAPYVEVGDLVRPDTVIGIIEVMKLMNPVSAGVSGTVVSFSVADAEAVEFGQELLRVEPA